MSSPFSTLSLQESEEDPGIFSNELGKNFSEWGFCGIKDHGIDESLVKEVMSLFVRFFELTLENKLSYRNPNTGGARGYTPYKIETPKDGTSPDLKEFWHVGRELASDSHYREWMPDNFKVHEIIDFNQKTKELFDQFDQLGKKLLSYIAVYLDLDKSYFEPRVDQGNSIMRAIHYPPVIKKEEGERAGPHEDINLITLLIGGHQSGLELLTKKGTWESINLTEDVIICNIGDMLQRLTNNSLTSTTHRVRATEEEYKTSRFSIPFFVHPNPDCLIQTLDNCYDSDNPNVYPESILAEDYLRERLKEIKLI